MTDKKFTYPFCYKPDNEIVKAAEAKIAKIRSCKELDDIFKDGKMLGVMKVEDSDGDTAFIYGFSGLAGNSNNIPGFVPPIFDLLDPEGHFKQTENIISAMNQEIKKGSSGSEELKEKRKKLSEELQDWLFSQYMVLNARGEEKSIKDIFADEGLTPPGGTGECAAPKMLQYAYSHKLKPLAMGEFWYGKSPEKEVRAHGCFYPSCTGKCGPLLRYMMQGLDVENNPLEEIGLDTDKPRIIYEDSYILVADKPSGMLSVPGRHSGICLQKWLQDNAAEPVELYSCHRLDMDTSGLIVFAKSPEIQAVMEGKFARRQVRKRYLATLIATEEKYNGPMRGSIELPLLLDWYDRPRQMVDFENGKKSVTEYEILEVKENGELLVLFTPLTGRSHQIRVHAAHHLGLGRPIKGDRLYGGFKDSESGKLHLRAVQLSFEHPVSGEELSFKL